MEASYAALREDFLYLTKEPRGCIRDRLTEMVAAIAKVREKCAVVRSTECGPTVKKHRAELSVVDRVPISSSISLAKNPV
ncbi:hypothetical protein RB195_002648 [Necator americanus]|uniref:Uncharacterized protein n=1 Tax=Necator americanus TaxID=51031 RepID=A0ABR1DK99_NECAM